MNKGGLPCGVLRAFFIDVVDTEEGTGEGGGFTKGDEEGLVDLALRINEDTAEEEDEAADAQNCGGNQLEFDFHNAVFFKICCKDIHRKGGKARKFPTNSILAGKIFNFVTRGVLERVL